MPAWGAYLVSYYRGSRVVDCHSILAEQRIALHNLVTLPQELSLQEDGETICRDRVATTPAQV